MRQDGMMRGTPMTSNARKRTYNKDNSDLHGTKYTTVNISPAVVQCIDDRRRRGESRSTRFITDLIDYHSMLQIGLHRAKMALSKKEAAMMLDMLIVKAPSPIAVYANGVFIHTVMGYLEHAKQHSDINVGNLIDKLERLGDISCIALADWADTVVAENTQHAEAIQEFTGK
jgi:hypothetical protein